MSTEHSHSALAGFFKSVRSRTGKAARNLWNQSISSSAQRNHRRLANVLGSGELRPQSILLLCYGNICRSPVAERMVKHALPNVTVYSAGFHAAEGRRSPENIRTAAESFQLQMADHTSQRVTEELVCRADLILLMDLENYRALLHSFPNAKSRVMLLGMFLNPPQLEIRDPYGLSIPETQSILEQIKLAVANFSALLTGSAHPSGRL